jgi:hypothetical protein
MSATLSHAGTLDPAPRQTSAGEPIACTIDDLARHLHAIDRALGAATGGWYPQDWPQLGAQDRDALIQDAKDFVASGDYILGTGWKSEDIERD